MNNSSAAKGGNKPSYHGGTMTHFFSWGNMLPPFKIKMYNLVSLIRLHEETDAANYTVGSVLQYLLRIVVTVLSRTSSS